MATKTAHLTTEIEVEGRGPFPIDMLRYDQCWPKTEIDSGKITRTFQRSGVFTWTIRLKGTRPPTIDRWESFGCHIASYHTGG